MVLIMIETVQSMQVSATACLVVAVSLAFAWRRRWI